MDRDAKRFPDRVIESGPGDWDRLAFDLVGQPGHVLEGTHDEVDVALRLAKGLTHIQGLKLGESGGLVLKEPGQPEECLGALGTVAAGPT